MRTIRTFILRLLIDSDAPEQWRGMLRAIAGDEEFCFTDGQALLALLHRLHLENGVRDDTHDLETETQSQKED